MSVLRTSLAQNTYDHDLTVVAIAYRSFGPPRFGLLRSFDLKFVVLNPLRDFTQRDESDVFRL
jgi:hypothetical protein